MNSTATLECQGCLQTPSNETLPREPQTQQAPPPRVRKARPRGKRRAHRKRKQGNPGKPRAFRSPLTSNGNAIEFRSANHLQLTVDSAVSTAIYYGSFLRRASLCSINLTFSLSISLRTPSRMACHEHRVRTNRQHQLHGNITCGQLTRVRRGPTRSAGVVSQLAYLCDKRRAFWAALQYVGQDCGPQ